MLFSILRSGDPLAAFLSLLLTLPIMLLALSLHETAHGWVAWRGGDPTARNLGRLTLNPLKHIDPMGLIFLMIFGYGWAKPVPINTRYFRKPKRDMALTAAAGPAANLLLGLINAVLYGLFWGLFKAQAYLGLTGMLLTFLLILADTFFYAAAINFMFMLFNLIPIPPFDGSRIALAFLPDRIYFGIMRYERQIMFGLLIVMLVLSNFGYSPIGYVATKLPNLIGNPIAQGIVNLLV